MKTISQLIILTAFSLFLVQPANGQKLLHKLKNKAKNKIEQRIEKRVEKKVDDKIDKELDKVEEEIDKNKKEQETDNEHSGDNEETREQHYQNRLQGIMKGLGMSGEPVPIEDNYSFDNLIQMHFDSYNKEGEKISTGEFITHLNPKTKSMAYEVVSGDMGEPGQGLFIVDMKNEAMIILGDDNGKKTGIVYGMKSFMQSMGENYEEDLDLSDSPESYVANPNVKKTGRTKTIAGYKCEEYLFNDETTQSEIWITKDLKLKTNDFFNAIFQTSFYWHGLGWGYLMEATSVEKETGEKSIMQVTKVDKNSNKTFRLNEYQITNLGSLAIPTGSEE